MVDIQLSVLINVKKRLILFKTYIYHIEVKAHIAISHEGMSVTFGFLKQ